MILQLLVALLERLRACFRNRMVLLARAAADADGADHLASPP
jgi:hypothetical protein